MANKRKNKNRRGRRDSKRAPKTPDSVETLISEHAELLGDLHFSGGLHLDGHIKGTVHADADDKAMLSVSESARIEGDVRVPHVVLNGAIDGDVHACERITLSAHARVSGDVYYRLIEMASGAVVNGQLVCEHDAESTGAASSGDDAISGDAQDTPDRAQEMDIAGAGS